MIQLRLFVQQRLNAAAEEILREVEKSITLALHDVFHHQHQHQKLNSLHQISEPLLTGEEVLQESPTQPSTKEGSTPSAAEVTVPPQTSADTDNSDGNYSVAQTNVEMKLKEEEESGDDGQTGEVISSFPEGVKSEQDWPETRVSYELQPVSSDCSAYPSAKSRNESRVCPTCGKCFQYIGPFIKHIKTHKTTTSSAKELLKHLQNAHNKRLFCDVCGKKFNNLGSLQTHSKIHSRIKDFECQDCGKTFVQKQHLAVHMRIHSGERPFRCDICGKTFIQRQNLTAHTRTHTGEGPYHHRSCGKQFYTPGHLKAHVKRFSGPQSSSCAQLI